MKALTSLAALAAIATAAELPELEFKPLFDGQTLAGWSGDGYVVEEGAIVCTPEGRNLVTDRIFANYVLDFEFKLPPGGNNGLGIHYPGEGDPAYTGMEIQILDDTAEKYQDLKDYQFHGSLYTMVPAKKGHLKPVGEWNRQRVMVRGDLVQVELNGTVITQANLAELIPAHPQHRGVRRRAGHLALCGHGDRVAFRSLQIAELPPSAHIEGVRASGFHPLLPGEDLAGWKTEQPGHWHLHNGVLVYDGQGADLWTEAAYQDFTLVCDWRWTATGPPKERPILDRQGQTTGIEVVIEEQDSGIYLRGSTQAQVNLWNWPIGSGEVWGYRTQPELPDDLRAALTPSMKADRRLGEWNRMLITMQDDQLTVVLNGMTVIQAAQLPGVPGSGPIGLQHHGSPIDFANLWIKEL